MNSKTHDAIFFKDLANKSAMLREDQEYTNKTTYGIKSDAVKYTWEVFLIFVAISSLIGDTTILVASIKYNAIKLQKTIVVIVQHIAVCDLMVVLTNVIPRIITIFADKWVFGSLACKVLAYARVLFILAGSFLICAMTICKTLHIKYPFRIVRISTKTAHAACSACWTIAAAISFLFKMASVDITYFSYRSYQCDYIDSWQRFYILKPISAVAVLFIPSCLVVATTTYILFKAIKTTRRVRGDLKWQGTVATLLTAFLYILSAAPQLIYRLLEYIYRSEENKNTDLLTHFYRIAVTFPLINTISNFYIYCLTITSFREFVFSTVSQCSCPQSFRNTQSANDNRK